MRTTGTSKSGSSRKACSNTSRPPNRSSSGNTSVVDTDGAHAALPLGKGAACALHNSLPEHLATSPEDRTFAIFLRGQIDLARIEGTSLATAA